MPCGGCGSKNKYEIYVIIDGQEFQIGSRPLYTFLRSLANRFEEGKEYTFVHLNKTTNAKIEGKLQFSNSVPYLNGRRLI